MRKLQFLPVLIICYLLPMAVMADQIDGIAELFKQANATELTKKLAPVLDVSILKKEETYSNTQAGIILSKFFTQNKPKSVKVLHRVNTSNTYRFGVLLLVTDKGTFRVSLTLNSVKGELQIIDLRIEAEKA
ncbi:DUF4783 domain-containing protein [Mucilaginibacter sp. UR6-1]|uniref:DUF4783 domain-containing protein n=1 Tax=Mucilaginibacter sp. UR6-1 TaxID=1435643 RepID=UPI001E4877E0|nr:DUF4783 domain-containing protein [Mucilaginibacter sp. UR6-1]MCC8408937.1 DUF4783 domain-containing protein [Mucilaginibacter sp. UR6-1]